MRKKSFRSSVLKRLIISFISILAPLYILGIFIYNNGLMILRQEISKSMTSQVSFYLERLENEVKRIRILQYDLINDRDINRMAAIPQSLNNIEQWQSLSRIKDRLFAIYNSSKYIESVSIMFPAAQKEVTVKTISQFSQDKYDRMMSVPHLTESGIANIDGMLYLNLPHPQWYMAERKPLFLIVIQLSTKALEEILQTMRNHPDEMVFVYHTRDGTTISAVSDDFHRSILSEIQKPASELMEGAKITNINGERYMISYRRSEYFQSVMVKYVPEKSFIRTMEVFNLWFILFTILALVIVVVFSVYMHKLIYIPLNRLADSFEQVRKGNFEINIVHRYEDEFGFIYQHFNDMVRDLDDLIDQSYKQKILIQRAELKQLQSQINPHFLYNSFFILNTMSRIGDYETLDRFTEQLGRYFQFITRNAVDEVTLLKEVEHARVYTEIQAVRFSNRIQVAFETLPEEVSEIMVPRLILQPIIENAFEHGLGMKISNGILSVRFEIVQGKLFIITENNGDVLDDKKMEILQSKLIDNRDENTEITALSNIHQRLRLKFGPEYGLNIKRGGMGGLRVIISIPCK